MISVSLLKQFGPFAGLAFTENMTIGGKSQHLFDDDIPAAKTGQLTTRTDNDTGVVTLTAGHGLTSGLFDVYWAGGVRRGMTGTIATNALSLDLGTGDNLPINLTNVTVSKPVMKEFRFDGDDMQLVMVYGAAPFVIMFSGDDDVPKTIFAKPSAGMVDSWYVGNGVVNPLAAAVLTRLWVSQGDATAAKAVRALVLYN